MTARPLVASDTTSSVRGVVWLETRGRAVKEPPPSILLAVWSTLLIVSGMVTAKQQRNSIVTVLYNIVSVSYHFVFEAHIQQLAKKQKRNRNWSQPSEIGENPSGAGNCFHQPRAVTVTLLHSAKTP